MRFRLGYVAMTLSLKDCSPSKTVTVASFNKIPAREAGLNKLKRTARENISNTLRILKLNKAMNINVFRLTSKLVPLATHPVTSGWDYVRELKDEFEEAGNFIKQNNFRVSAHPDHYTLINSVHENVLACSMTDLDYHVRLFEAMGLSDYRYKLVMHVGGLYKDKAASIERFKENFIKLPDRIRKRIILENDDKSYTASDVLEICRDLKIPMVLDVHHHNCVNNGEELKGLLPGIFDTWDGEYYTPKIHFSSPKSSKDYRSHADDICFEEFTGFLKTAVSAGRNFDIMLEAKNKDMALLKLSAQLKETDWVKSLNEGEFEV